MKVKKLKMGILVLFALASGFAFRSSRVLGSPLNTDGTGAELFKAKCARCHGENGEGGKGPNLTTEKKKAKWKDSDEKLRNKIRNGGIIMPSFKSKLSDAEIKLIAEHVRQLPPVSN